jgi:hypothetical protein
MPPAAAPTSRDSISHWTDQERADVTSWLRHSGRADSHRRHPFHLRLGIFAVLPAAVAAMAIWVGILATSLPDTASVGSWRLAWVGFDVVLTASLGLTAWMTWKRKPAAIVPLATAFTLLICDAWFDICLSWGTGDQTTTLVTAILELPLLALLYSIGHTIIRRQTNSSTTQLALATA